MRHAPCLFTAALVWFFLQGGPARGDFIPWKYGWTSNPSIVYSDTTNTTYITLSDEMPPVLAVNSSDIVATNLKTFSDASPEFPDTFTNKPYTLTLFLLDVQSNTSGTLDFSGLLNGAVSSFTSEVTTTFTGPTEKQIVLGNHLYDVTFGPYTPPGPPTATLPGSIGAHARVRVTDIQKTPEPSTLVLALLGLPAVGYRLWRRRKKGEPAA